MKPRTIILAAVFGGIVLSVSGFLIADCADAQTPVPRPDIPLARQGSIYNFRCQPVEPIDKMNQICAVRTDQIEPIELGCVPSTTLDIVEIEVTIERTPDNDALVRCYATDTEGNVSDYSDNAGIADFIPPGKPYVN
jgi:hypothetical protein